jgi:hypothetical protein
MEAAIPIPLNAVICEDSRGKEASDGEEGDGLKLHFEVLDCNAVCLMKMVVGRVFRKCSFFNNPTKIRMMVKLRMRKQESVEDGEPLIRFFYPSIIPGISIFLLVDAKKSYGRRSGYLMILISS